MSLSEEEKKTRLIKWGEIRHFTPDEFDSPDAKETGLFMNLEFIKILDRIRDKVGFPMHISSGYRTMDHNTIVGGKDGSAHTDGCAADIVADTSGEKFEIVRSAIEQGIRRVGIGKNFVHLDMSFTHPQNVIWLYNA